mgnify:CR=1 FL=1
MISKQEILDRAQEWQLAPNIVEKDYVIGWLLWGLANYTPLKDVWIFKGGTCLKKCFIETYRFSEDLDFTVLPSGPVVADAVAKLMPGLLSVVSDASGINFAAQPPRFKDRPTFSSTEGRVYYQGPLQASPAGVKLDISGNETVAQPSVLRPISHSYTDTFPTRTSSTVRCYGLEEVFAEKIRALGQRYRPRDLYDVVNLYRRRDLRIAPSLILSVLTKKCEAKGIPLPAYASLVNSPLHQELEGEWANMLAHQLPALPPIDMFLSELESVFDWLHGKTEPAALQPIRGQGEDIDSSWTPPPTVWAWGQGVALEPIRFAGANRLCVDLTYQGSVRRIEPYSLRRTRAGALLLYAVKVTTGEIRSYRVDRIRGVVVSIQPFSPRYAVEFTPTAQIVESAPLATLTIPTARRSSGYSRVSRPRRASSSGTTYTIQCPYCQKEFRRSSMNLTLGTHKDAYGGSRCPGSGRRGYLV